MRFLLSFFIGLFASTSLVSARPVTANQIPAKVRYLCIGDYLRLCATVIPGDGRLVACIKKIRSRFRRPVARRSCKSRPKGKFHGYGRGVPRDKQGESPLIQFVAL
jgi:hypothetical protein